MSLLRIRFHLRLFHFALLLLRDLIGFKRLGVKRLLAFEFALRSRGDIPIIFWWPFFVRKVVLRLKAKSLPPGPTQFKPAIDFPPQVPRFDTDVENFAGDPSSRAFTSYAIPWDEAQLALVVNWAHDKGRRVRALGNRHSWSRGTIDEGRADDVLLDMRRFDGKQLDPKTHLATFGAGVTIEEASAFLRASGRALACMPAVGEATFGGMFSTGAHGTGVGVERCGPGSSGTINHLVRWIRVVRWNGTAYDVETFHIPSPEAAALTLGLGAALITAVGLETTKAYDLVTRSDAFFLESYFDEGFLGGPPPSYTSRKRAGRLVDDLREQPARLELMWYPYQGALRGPARRRVLRRKWVQRPARKPEALKPAKPYRDPLINFAALDTDEAFREGLRKSPTSRIGRRFQNILSLTGLGQPKLDDAHGGRLYASRFIPRFHAAGWCLIVRRERARFVLRAVADLLFELQKRHGFPLTSPVEVRLTDVDDSPARGAAALSPCRAPEEQEDDLCALWLNVMTDLGEASGRLLRDLETWLLGQDRANPRDAGILSVRPEWAKGWGYDGLGKAWSDATVIKHLLEAHDGYTNDNLADVATELDKLDPHAVFRGPLAELVLF